MNKKKIKTADQILDKVSGGYPIFIDRVTAIYAMHEYHNQFEKKLLSTSNQNFVHTKIDSLIKILANGLDEHITLLKKVNEKLTIEEFWDYQTVSESNEALIELQRCLDNL